MHIARHYGISIETVGAGFYSHPTYGLRPIVLQLVCVCCSRFYGFQLADSSSSDLGKQLMRRVYKTKFIDRNSAGDLR